MHQKLNFGVALMHCIPARSDVKGRNPAPLIKIDQSPHYRNSSKLLQVQTQPITHPIVQFKGKMTDFERCTYKIKLLHLFTVINQQKSKKIDRETTPPTITSIRRTAIVLIILCAFVTFKENN